MHIQILVQRLGILEPSEEWVQAIEGAAGRVVIPCPQVLHGDALVELLAGVEEGGVGSGGVETDGYAVCVFGDPEEDKTDEPASHAALMGLDATRTGVSVGKSPVALREPASASRARGRERRYWSAANWRC